MKLFVDANILISVLNKEYPLFSFTSRILSLSGTSSFQVFTSPVCLAITFYFAGKKHGISRAKKKIGLLCQHINIIGCTAISVRQILDNKAIHDLEDGIEYYAALESQCQCIVTEDTRDFYFSAIEVLNSRDFYMKYMTGKA